MSAAVPPIPMKTVSESGQGIRTKSPGRILVVDDEPRLTASLCELLTREGHEAQGAISVTQARELLHQERFDLVVTDIRMPDGDGMDVLRDTHSIDPACPVILVTAYASVESAVTAINEGAYDYLIKPIEPRTFQLTVRRAIEQRRLQLATQALMDDLSRSNLALSHRIAELDALHEVSTALSTTAELPSLLRNIIRLATGVIGATHGSIMLVDNKRGVLTVAAAEGIAAHQYQGIQLPFGESIAGTVAATGEPILIANVETDARFARRNRPQFETRSLICAPLKTPNAVVGVISLSDKRDAPTFSPDDLRLLATLAVQAAIAIEDAQHFQSIRQRLDEMTALHELSNRLAEVERTDQMVMAVFACLDQLLACDCLQWWQWDAGNMALRLDADTSHHLPLEPAELAVKIDAQELRDPRRCATTIAETLTRARPDDTVGAVLAVPVRSAGQPLGVFAVVRQAERPFEDSDLRLAQVVGSQAERIFDRQRALWNASRLVTMGKMISEISHDLRKPLTNIRGSLQVLRARLDPGDQAATILQSTEEEVVRLAALVTELVDFSNPKRYHTERHDLRSILQRTLGLVGQTARKHQIAIDSQIPPSLHPIFCDENQLTEALLNVFMNAIEAMPNGGTLKVTALAEPSFPTGEEQITISIADTGPGMTPAELARCFERYYTTKPTGTGLGLAIVERIVRAHDGQVHAESTPGAGTVFRLHFPVR